jgi:hypothetical protein
MGMSAGKRACSTHYCLVYEGITSGYFDTNVGNSGGAALPLG